MSSPSAKPTIVQKDIAASTSTLNPTVAEKPTTDSEASTMTSQSDKESTNALLRRLDHACFNLTPGFFSLNMGTGITSILLYNFPYPADWLKTIGVIIFVLNIVIFAALALGNIMRYIRFKGVFVATLTHPAAGLFWGTLPMGFATIVNMVAFVCVPAWGESWAWVALGLWWFDAVLSVVVNLGMLFAIFAHQQHTANTMSAVWLLPIVSSVVAAASGGVVASAIMPFSPSTAISTVTVSYVIWGTGVPIACFIMALWIHRTAIVGLPPAGALCSVFLPLGPCGQGSFGIILLGRTVRHIATSYGTAFAIQSSANDSSLIYIANAIYAGGLVTGLVLWGLGLCWYLIAFAIIINHTIQKPNRDFFHHSKFSVGFWALTFPIGVFATATDILGTELNSPAFRVIAAFLAVQVALHWLFVTGMTTYNAINGSIFVAPENAKFDGVPVKRFARQERDLEGQC